MYGRDFFPALRLGDGVLSKDIKLNRKGLNRRAAYAEAELFIQNKLSQGYHPEIIDAKICAEIMSNEGSDYKTMFLKYARRIIDNLRGSDSFGGLSSRVQYEKITIVRDQRARYEKTMYERFAETGIIGRYGLDDEFAREIAAAEALDPRQEDTLREMRELEHRQIEEQYRANEEALRAELADANFRVESAEQQLHFQDAQFALRPSEVSTTKYGSTRGPDSNFSEPRASSYSQYAPLEGGRTGNPDRDDMRGQRSYRPGFDDHGMPINYFRDVPNRHQAEVGPGYRYVDGTRLNRDRSVPRNQYSNGQTQYQTHTRPQERSPFPRDPPGRNGDHPAAPSYYPDYSKHQTHSTRRQPSAHGRPMPPSTRGPPTESSRYGRNNTSRFDMNAPGPAYDRAQDDRSAAQGMRDDESFRGGKCWTLPTDSEARSSSPRGRADRSTVRGPGDDSSFVGGKIWTLPTDTESLRHSHHGSTHSKQSSSAPRGFGWTPGGPSEVQAPRRDESVRGGKCWTLPTDTESGYSRRRR